ncbi:MAG TPA: ABC transporter ATP-binding protein [Candidatus Riflebacteria bacterium]|jgi:iron complex transport system ATP-binding protein|nr:MAG: ABC transporter ATP-binding protein [Candidatus Riflebacteria bacterium HGW-Riflebacteria-1]HAE38864.1 ABC transporter ATP-binding protein [Candidatus Riflebacteria bacterium]
MNEAILEFNSLRFAYQQGSALVLEDFSMQIGRGGVVAVLGPNGTGKTTMLMLALGWLTPAAGTIKLLGQPLAQYARRELGQKISLVPQFEPTFFDFSLIDFALLGRAPYLGSFSMPGPQDYEIARQALAKVGMAEKAERSVMNISGGEHQLVLLARSLAQQTELMLLDEPTSHLDIKNKSRLLAILRELVAEGKTIVFTTHEPDVAAMIADSVIMVKGGRVMHAGRVADVMTGKNLSEIYDTRIEAGEYAARRVFLWD